ncbi:hypothetical protein AcW2_006360 [Taiwanofungus camphoratus]|nr:hypothetical protein AcW2_006360 [Antrodia cinnamomea]
MGEKPYVVFGYGSLIFKPPPHVIAQVPGFLKGYVRRFAQMSHDHRGTPENPGRAVTLVHNEDWEAFSGSDPFPHDDVVWGIAYTINPLYESEVRDYLDYREKDGYTLEQLDVYGLENGVEKVVVHNREDDAEPALCRIHTPGDHSATSAITTTRPSSGPSL